jgi:sugar phosphate isomerase/epimerase
MTAAVHPRVSVSGVSTWNAALDDDISLYEQLGIHTVGAALRKLTGAGDVDRLRDSGVRVGNVIGVGPFTLDKPMGWPRQRDRLAWAFDVAQQLEAPAVVITTGPGGRLEWDAAADAFAAAMEPLLPAPGGLQICLEHTNSLRSDVGFVHTLADAVDLARRLDISVCMEVNACWAERNLSFTIAAGADRIGLVQVSDYEIGTTTTPDRLVPGDGDIPLARIIGDVLATGYGGMFDIEVVGPRVEEEGYVSVLQRSVTYTTQLLDSLGDSDEPPAAGGR